MQLFLNSPVHKDLKVRINKCLKSLHSRLNKRQTSESRTADGTSSVRVRSLALTLALVLKQWKQTLLTGQFLCFAGIY